MDNFLNKFTILILFKLFYATSTFAQNLILNGSFEEENKCLELKSYCSPIAWYSTSTSEQAFGYGRGFYAKKGKRYAYFAVADMQHKTSIQTWLKCPIQAGKKYRLSFWFRKKDNYDYLPFGFYFSNQFEVGNANFHCSEQAHVKINAKDLPTKPKKGKWYKVKIDFTAPFNADYMTIGNFDIFKPRMDAPVPKWYLKDETVNYYIDEIMLEPINKTEECSDVFARTMNLYEHRLRHTHNKTPVKNDNKSNVSKTKNTENQSITKKSIESETKNSTLFEQPKLDNLKQEKKPEIIVLPNVFFEFDKYELRQNYLQEILNLLEPLKKKTFHHLEITGHTDNIGNENYNQELSFKRAESIANLLIINNICKKEQIKIFGKGASNPKSSNETEEGRQQNRRVEVYIWE